MFKKLIFTLIIGSTALQAGPFANSSHSSQEVMRHEVIPTASLMLASVVINHLLKQSNGKFAEVLKALPYVLNVCTAVSGSLRIQQALTQRYIAPEKKDKYLAVGSTQILLNILLSYAQYTKQI